MPQSTDLSVAPYLNDFDANDQYHRVLFQPGQSPQVQEFNTLQSILQNQVEQFGDKVLSQGTIVSGCTFQFIPQYAYVKLRDDDSAGVPLVVANLETFFVSSANSGLRAYITNSKDGFESTTPNLKTIYVSYVNAGNDHDTHTFSPGEELTVTDANLSIWSVNVVSAGISFANSDTPVFIPALIVNVTSGSFTVGDYVTQPTTKANLQIVTIDAATLANDDLDILYLKPRIVDLANGLVNSSAWSVANNDSIRNSSNTAVGSVLGVVGSDATGSVLTDGSGRVIDVSLLTGGAGYLYVPTTTIRSVNNATGLASLSLTAENFLTKPVVANTVDALGNGYGFAVTAGTIYQKGYFLHANAQIIVVDRYDTSPNNISVAFTSTESIVTPRQDSTLYDNALGTNNYRAPGANRLKIVPTLELVDPSNTSPDIVQLVVWNEGNPVIVRQDTQYGELEKDLARREFENWGNFAVDRFNIGTRSPANTQLEANTFSLVIDPGLAYVHGFRTKTERNFVFSCAKGIDTNTTPTTVGFQYDNWIPIANVGGVFLFSTGDTVQLYDTAKGYLGNGSLVAAGNLAPVGTQIGTARMHSMKIADTPTAPPGDPNAQYQLYLFDIEMNQGQNFANVHSVYYSGATSDGIADVVLTYNPRTNTSICQYANTTYKGVVFPSNDKTLEIANATYIYRTVDQGRNFANTGLLTKTLSGSEYWPYTNSASLSNAQLQEQYVVPYIAMRATANVPGTATVNTTSNLMVGSSTTFQSNLVPDDWVYISNGSTTDVRRVVAVANNTRIQMDANSTVADTGCAVYRYFPQYVPIPFGFRSGLVGNVNSGGQTLTLSLGMALGTANTSNAAVATNIQRQDVAYGTKTANRNQWVVIKISNNAAGTTGPWCLGVADIMRLKRVAWFQNIAPPYSSPQLAANSHDVTDSFYIDQRQRNDYLDLGYLCFAPGSSLSLTATDYLAVQFDAFLVGSSDFYCGPSYVTANATNVQTADSTPLANLGSNVASFEVPVVGARSGIDLLSAYDFRPIVVNTATSTTTLSSATVNPANTRSFGNTQNSANDLKTPKPDSFLTANVTRYLPRVDAVVLAPDTTITVIRGQPGTASLPNVPSNSMVLGYLTIPAYPNVTQNLSNTAGEIITTRVLNKNHRLAARTIISAQNANLVFSDQPVRYTMGDVQLLEQRIRNLEYYTSLSALQTDMVNKVIPSGVNPAIDRFKYGLQVDNFSDPISQAYDDLQYAATIETGMLTPRMVKWVVRHGVGRLNSNYLNFQIISQPLATSPVDVVVANAAVGWLLRVDADTVGAGNTTGPTNPVVTLVDYETVTVAGVAAPVAFYWFVPKIAASVQINTTVLGRVFYDPVEFTIYQGNTQLFTARANTTTLSNSNVTFLKSNSVPASWFVNTELAANNVLFNGNGVAGSGKILWTHNPSSGNLYTIKSVRQGSWDHWRYAMSYPAVAPTIPAPQILSTGILSYQGVIVPQPTTFVLQINPPAPFASSGGGIAASGSLIWTNQVQSASYHEGPNIRGGGTVVVQSSSGQVSLTGGINIPGSPFRGGQLTGDAADFVARENALVNTTLIPQGFYLVLYGLKPLTQHTFSVGGVDQTTFCKPFGGNIGDPLMSDDLGMIQFNYYYTGAQTQQSITSQLLSNTAPIQTSVATWLSGVTEQPIGDGSILFELSAPNSGARYLMQVAASPTIPLRLLTHAGT